MSVKDLEKHTHYALKSLKKFTPAGPPFLSFLEIGN